MRAGILLSCVLWGLAAFTLTGCGLNAKLEAYPIDERIDKQEVYTRQMSLKCRLGFCGNEQKKEYNYDK